jgi:UDP-N-acetylmuramoyl-L-alanyl-D-glutamate--2,6-diaminopimelate ligase
VTGAYSLYVTKTIWKLGSFWTGYTLYSHPTMNYHYDSRNIRPGDTYICLPGGEKFIADAQLRGAIATLTMDRVALGNFSNQLFDTPSQRIPLIGVTGTNGKTTVTHLICAGLIAAGYKPALIGTLNAPLTTPESLYVNQTMAEHIANGGTHFVMEVSSHAISQNRIAGLHFAVKVLTNITQDHLDYHKTFEAYRDTKLGFMGDGNAVALYPESYQKHDLPFPVPLPGMFNYHNFQAAMAALRALGIPDDQFIPGLATATAPPGRFEAIHAGQPFLVIVDYAHTPDGLENVLTESRRLAEARGGKTRVLFGCGGDRDRGKRPKMAAIAAQYADTVVITSDNPRTESPTQIFADILAGLTDTTTPYQVIEDRREAIFALIAQAQPADVLMIAGKGHETVQILADKTIPFDDRGIAREALTHGQK